MWMKKKFVYQVGNNKKVTLWCTANQISRYTCILTLHTCSYVKYTYAYITATYTNIYLFFFLLWRCDPTRVMTSSFLRFLAYTQRRTTVGRTPLDEWSARRRDLYLTTHDTHNRQISMPPVGFEPTISVGERPQNYALDRAATGTGTYQIINIQKYWCYWTVSQQESLRHTILKLSCK